MKILFIGDIVGKIGRKAIIKILPELKKEFEPDLILANGENLAHGKGVTLKIVKEMLNAGIDGLTSGNHIWSKRADFKKVVSEKLPVIRPANYLKKLFGNSQMILKKGKKKALIINLLGQVFIKDKYGETTNPFKKIDKILKANKKTKIILVDFHAEATAEKAVLGRYLDGRVSVLLGTHTHIPTADEQILKNGTAFITDVGMVGAKDSSIGNKIEPIIEHYLTGCKRVMEIPETGTVVANAVLIEINDKTGRAISIQRIAKEVEIV
ncbi:MAG: TIGR00282 family metallophosphoesterase [Patescibacteria group bacterium]|nr:TIGR00282 family metallophosphoesterase [Patescibacteria group bacterium]